MTWSSDSWFARLTLGMVLVSAGLAVCGCDDEPEVAPEDRMVRVTLEPADRDAIMEDRFAGIRAAILEIRLMEAERPDPEVDREGYARHADEVDERTRRLIAVMADERWSKDERRLMQRVLRFATADDLRDDTVEAPADASDG